MSKSLVILFSLFFFKVSSQELVLDGKYTGSNFFIQNPASGQAGCIRKIFVNDKEVHFTPSAVFAIRLDSLDLKPGDPVKIIISHNNDCKPKVIMDFNHPKRKFELVSSGIDNEGVLHWITSREVEHLPFLIEQFSWNKWVTIGEVKSKGGLEKNEYSFKLKPHSGKNQFRIRQINVSGTILFNNPEPEVEIISEKDRIQKELLFNKETMFELYDGKGNILIKGRASAIDFSGLPYELYYLNYDNRMVKVTRVP